MLWEQLKCIPKHTGSGVDGQDVETTKETFELWCQEMLDAIHRRGYRPPPARRVYIPKPGRVEKRPIAVPTVADRALQRATSEVLNAIYEQDFLNSSFGGRPHRSAHQTIATVIHAISNRKVSWVYEADLKDFFGSLNHGWVERFLSKRVGDPRLVTLIRRWLKAGVMEEGSHQYNDKGATQGNPISVVISNLYLHYVLDLWIEKVVKPRMKGEVYYIRYLDDFVVCFQYHTDATRFQRVIGKRLSKFSLALEPSKTRLVQFGRFAEENAKARGDKVATLKFLGFSLYCGKSKSGGFKIGTKTQKERLRRSCMKTKELLRKIRHRPLREQAKAISQQLTGHYRYYGVAGNSGSLERLFVQIDRYWRKMLSSRSQKGRLSWQQYKELRKIFPFSEIPSFSLKIGVRSQHLIYHLKKCLIFNV